MPNYRRHYIPESMVFITVVTNNRKPLLIDNVELLRESIRNCKFDFEIYAGVIIHDHLHMILNPKDINNYPKIISSIKYSFSRNIEYKKQDKTPTEIKRKEKGVWQRRYYDHIIRDEKDLNKHLDYIHYNPIKHNLVNAAKDWEYSSFSKFVKNGLYELDWCNLENKNDCNSLIVE